MSMESAIAAIETPAPSQAGEQKDTPDNGLKQASEAAISTETPVPVVGEPAVEKVEPVSAKFAALAKKEKQLVLKQTALKTNEAALVDRETKLAAREQNAKDADALWDTDVFGALKLRGLDYNKLTELFLAGERAPKKEAIDPATEAKNAIEQFKKEFADKEAKKIADDKQAAQDKVKAEEERVNSALEAYGTEVKAFTKKNADDYELINIYEQHQLVVETVKDYYDMHGRALSVKEACDATENYLVAEAKKAQMAKKFATKKTEEIVVPTAKKETKTLTNNMTPVAASVLPAANEADRMKRALAALNNTQK